MVVCLHYFCTLLITDYKEHKVITTIIIHCMVISFTVLLALFTRSYTNVCSMYKFVVVHIH